MRTSRGWAGAVLAALLLAAGCGRSGSPPSARGPAVELSGSILGSGQPFGTGLFEYTLPGLRAHRLDVGGRPSEGVGFGLDFLGAYWEDAEHVLTVATGADGLRSHLVEVSTTGAPRRIGQNLSYVSTFDVKGSRVVAATCRSLPGKVWVLDLKHPDRWRQIDRSCVAALSPDGATVALVRSNTEVWGRPVDGGSASLVVDVAKLPEIRRAHLGRLIVTRLAWGQGGLVVAVGSEQELEGRGGRNMIVTRDPGGRVGVLPLPPQAWDVPSRPWQPKGRLLALIGRPSSGGAIVRLFDPMTGKVSVVAADTQYFGNVAWSPDGRLLAANTSTNALLFFDTRGNWIKRAGLGGVGLLDWGP